MNKFVEEYLLDLNPGDALLRAGYKVKHEYRHKVAAELMVHPLVREAIEKGMEERKERNAVTQDYVLAKLVSIVEATENGNPQAALRGLELLGKHLGLYKDRQEISGPDGGAIEMEKKEIQDSVADFTSKLSRLASRGGTGEVVEFPKRQGESGT
jgi:phage terminase small subunit